MTHPHDQLRWQLTEDLAICLDVAENIVIEAGTERVAVPHPTMLIEGLRQARSAQLGDDRPDPAIFAMRTALLKFAKQVADSDLVSMREASETLADLAADARKLLGLPGPAEVLDPLPAAFPYGIGPAHVIPAE
jgi:hypothetical protein